MLLLLSKQLLLMGIQEDLLSWEHLQVQELLQEVLDLEREVVDLEVPDLEQEVAEQEVLDLEQEVLEELEEPDLEL